MDRDEAGSAPFDEHAAQEELERIRQDIARSRAQRAAIGEEFERFVRSFKTGDPPPRRPLASEPVAAAHPSAAFETEAVPLRGDPHPHPHPHPRPRSRSASAKPALLGGALVVLVASGLLVKTIRNRAADSSATTVNAPEAPVAAAQPQPAPPVSPPLSSAAVPESSLETAITTTRRVWMRVTVDGVKVLEREVPAATRVPLQAKQTIVIRTGDAGAVRLTIRGQERGSLGAEGEVVTRSFTVPSR